MFAKKTIFFLFFLLLQNLSNVLTCKLDDYCRVKLGVYDLSGLDLSYADLRGIDFGYKNLSKANLSHAVFDEHSNFENTILRGADLSYTTGFENAFLYRTNLSDSNLTGVHLDWFALVKRNVLIDGVKICEQICIEDFIATMQDEACICEFQYLD